MTIKHDIQQLRDNLSIWFDQANEIETQEGELWYEIAGYTLKGLASIYGVSKYCVAGICAALSPQNHWLRNVKDTQRILYIHYTSIDIQTATTTILESRIHTRANLQKCVDCLYSHKPLVTHIADTSHYLTVKPNDILGGNKVRSFYLNLMGELDVVTVDTWVLRAAEDDLSRQSFKLTDNYYIAIETAIRFNAYALKIEPAVYQAIVWIAIRNRAPKQRGF